MKYEHLNIYTINLKKVGIMIKELKNKGICKQGIKETILGYYSLFAIAFFGHKGTAYQKRKVKEINWYIEMYDIL